MVHRLKSSAAEFGALRLSGLCSELDSIVKLAKSNSTEVETEIIRTLVRQIETSYGFTRES